MITELAKPAEVAQYLRSTTSSLAQMRYRGEGPKFVRMGRRVLYRSSRTAFMKCTACSASSGHANTFGSQPW
jgi:hypothetical protein